MKNSTGYIIILLICIAIFLFGLSFLSHPRQLSFSKQEAIAEVAAAHPELRDFDKRPLPPSSIETESMGTGFNIAYVERGSGIDSILTARCFSVTSDRKVISIGTYQNNGSEIVKEISLANCIPKNPIPTQATSTSGVLPYGNAQLSVGNKAAFNGISITPVSILEDSRCPTDVQCIQAGTVRVNLKIETATSTVTRDMKLGSTTNVGNYSITFASVLPDKHSKTTLQKSDYKFTFTIKEKVPVPVVGAGKCYVGGCSSQICSDQPDTPSTCEYREQYACYKTAVCERQKTGQCGWTDTAALRMCLSL